MIRTWSFLFSLLVFFQLVGTVHSEWHCGSGSVSRKLAWALTIISDRKRINTCCEKHDNDYDAVKRGHYPWTLRLADLRFGDCLDRVCSSFYDRYIVRPIFTVAVRINSWLCRVFGIFC